MDNFSILIAGKAGDGIDKSSLIIGHIFNQVGYRIYIYRDYPSVIRGGHTFSIIRCSQYKITTHLDTVDVLLALNQDSIDFHKSRLGDKALIIYDSTSVKSDEGLGIPIGIIIKEAKALELMRNSCIIGAMCKALGIGMDVLEKVFRKNISREIDLNLDVAFRGFSQAKEFAKVEKLKQKPLPLITGNEAIGLGLIKGGLKTYISYPMTPSSGVLHFLAEVAIDFSLKVIHPENEIAVMLMAAGFSYTGDRVAVGTSGGGFCLMTEGLSLSGMAELPIVVVLGQRPGPSTGLPTYTGQTELNFALSAGQGEFTRFLVAPGDAEEAYYWSTISMNLAWKYQVPAIILCDKTLNEGTYSFDAESIGKIKGIEPLLWNKEGEYKRYQNTENGISSLAFPSDKDAIIKVNSYEHNEAGITIEDKDLTVIMQDKRFRKERYLLEELEQYEVVKVYGKKDASIALLFWGSNKGPCVEIGLKLGLKVVQPVVLSPFPLKQFKEALKGVKKIICVENNSTGQLVNFLKFYNVHIDHKILKYDGRPFTPEELEQNCANILTKVTL
ncbi:MAG: 2-oxoacid:acceptor oxidoreductase subunit alpha [Candidatus Omnitrophica bacterium]|nr:2-oxoacid:acceptor oxidoreductase subunit alpha [Candidatus Omnitrophota bacterium]